MIVVNPSTRQFNVPGADLVFGVESDSGSVVKEFQCPRYVGNDLDLAGSFLRMNYRNANGEIDEYLVKDVTISGENIEFRWELTPKVTMYKGQISFVLCVVGPDTKVKWHTTLGKGQVLEGLEPDNHFVEEETDDVVAQLIAMVEAQTAAVEKTGADQVAVVNAAAKTAQDSAVAQIESKGASTLGTIPEDYTAVQNAVRGAANAIRGNVSGEVIRVDDVSPMEHYPVVKVHGKNLFNIGALEVMPASNTTRISAVDIANNTFTITTASTHTGNGYCGFTNAEGNYIPSLRDFCPQMKAGRTYVLSGITESSIKTLYLRGINRSWVFGTALAITEEHLDAKIAMYGLDASKGEGTGDCAISNIQIEEGVTATEYVPYINPTTVTVIGCGKNILPYPYATAKQTYNGITFTPNEDGSVTINGTATGDSSFMFVNPNVGQRRFLPAGTYFLSCPELASADNRAIAMPLFYYDSNETADVSGTIIRNNVLTLAEGKYYGLYLRVYNGTTVSNLIVHPQLEQGNVATGYEIYKGETQIPADDGTVTGLKSVSPTMSLLTDTPGVIIDCEYSRDTNKVIEDILNKLTALVGNN